MNDHSMRVWRRKGELEGGAKVGVGLRERFPSLLRTLDADLPLTSPYPSETRTITSREQSETISREIRALPSARAFAASFLCSSSVFRCPSASRSPELPNEIRPTQEESDRAVDIKVEIPQGGADLSVGDGGGGTEDGVDGGEARGHLYFRRIKRVSLLLAGSAGGRKSERTLLHLRHVVWRVGDGSVKVSESR